MKKSGKKECFWAKKAVGIFLMMYMTLALFWSNPMTAEAATADDAISWVQAQVGKAIDYDKVYGAQCVDLIKAYYNYLGVSPVSGNGADYAWNSLPSGWQRIHGAVPQKGDILVYSGNSSNPAGHVAIFESTRVTYHQNFDNQQYVQKITNISYNGFANPYWGVIRPNFTSSAVVSGTQTISDGEYHIVSALDPNKGLDVENASKENDANIRLYENRNDAKQVFRVTYLGDGYYKIVNTNSNKSMDVDLSGQTDGTNVKQFTDYGSDAQKWIIKESGDGKYFYIISKCNGLYLDVADGNSANGTNVQMWTGNQSKAQKWRFIAWGGTTGQTVPDGSYHIVTALDSTKGLDVDNASKEDKANIQIFSNTADPTQTFSVKYLENGYYKITSDNSGKSLDLNNDSTVAGTNVQQYVYNASDQQNWILKYAGDSYFYIISKGSGLYLDVALGNTADKTNVQGYIGNQTAAQKWKFVPVKTPQLSVDTEGRSVKFTFTPVDWADGYNLRIFDQDNKDFTKWNITDTTVEVDLPTGSYTAYVDGGNDYFYQKGNTVEFEWEEPPQNPFADISESDYYYDAVLWAYENGVTSGLTETEFKPGESCTRAQMVAFLWRASGEPEAKTEDNPFTDIRSDAYYYEAVLWAYENGIASGTSSTTFDPDGIVDRGQVVTFIWRSAGQPDVKGENPFADIGDDTYYYKAVLWAYENGITSGITEDLFKPADPCSRGQVVTFLYRDMA